MYPHRLLADDEAEALGVLFGELAAGELGLAVDQFQRDSALARRGFVVAELADRQARVRVERDARAIAQHQHGDAGGAGEYLVAFAQRGGGRQFAPASARVDRGNVTGGTADAAGKLFAGTGDGRAFGGHAIVVAQAHHEIGATDAYGRSMGDEACIARLALGDRPGDDPHGAGQQARNEALFGGLLRGQAVFRHGEARAGRQADHGAVVVAQFGAGVGLGFDDVAGGQR